MMSLSYASFSPSLPCPISISNSKPSLSAKVSYGYGYGLLFGPKSSNSVRLVRRNRGLTCNALFGLGVPELVVIAGVVALVFGPKKLPEVGRSIGKTVKSFQQAAKEFESEIKKEPDSIGGDSSEKPIAVNEQEKQDVEVSSSKESV